MDKKLAHLPKSIGSYEVNKSSSTAKTTRSSSTAKDKDKISSGAKKVSSGGRKRVAEEEDGTKRDSSGRKRKLAQRCVVCSALAVTKEERSKINRSVYRCYTCCIHLCIDKKSNRKFKGFERFHMVKELPSTLKSRNVTPKAPTRRSPWKNPKAPARRSPRKKPEVTMPKTATQRLLCTRNTQNQKYQRLNLVGALEKDPSHQFVRRNHKNDEQ